MSLEALLTEIQVHKKEYTALGRNLVRGGRPYPGSPATDLRIGILFKTIGILFEIIGILFEIIGMFFKQFTMLIYIQIYHS